MGVDDSTAGMGEGDAAGSATPMSLSMILGSATSTPTNRTQPLPPLSTTTSKDNTPTRTPTASLSEIVPPAIVLSPTDETTSPFTTAVLPPRAQVLSDDSSDSEDEDEEEDEEEDKETSDSSDLDDEELAEEELLVQRARATAKGAATERYHDAQHQSKILKVDTAVSTSTAIATSRGSPLHSPALP